MARPNNVQLKILTPEQVEEVKRMRATPTCRSQVTGTRVIAAKMGVSEYAVCRALGFDRKPGGRNYIDYRNDPLSKEFGLGKVRITIPDEVLLERERAMDEPRSMSAVAFGDPPFSRSALGKRNGEARQEAQDGATREEWPAIARAGDRSKLGRQADAASQWQRLISGPIPDHSTG